jgi:hypothetical protein
MGTLLLVSCAPPSGATSTAASMSSPAPLPSPTGPGATPSPSPEPEADLVGHLIGMQQLETGCIWLIDGDRKSWEIKWPAGYEFAWEQDQPVLKSATEGVIAREGDRIGLRGTLGWFAEGDLTVKFNVREMDPVAAKGGSTAPREGVVKRWASGHGLSLYPRLVDSWWWHFAIVDGTPDQLKADQLKRLPEVEKAARVALGSFCMVGSPFTAKSIAFVLPFASQ